VRLVDEHPAGPDAGPPQIVSGALSLDNRYLAYGDDNEKAFVDVRRIPDGRVVRTVRLPFRLATMPSAPTAGASRSWVRGPRAR
jgi:hypothetical protein